MTAQILDGKGGFTGTSEYCNLEIGRKAEQPQTRLNHVVANGLLLRNRWTL